MVKQRGSICRSSIGAHLLSIDGHEHQGGHTGPANIVYSRHGHYVILVSERSLLPVVTTARDPDNLVPRFFVDLELVLEGLKVPRRNHRI
jgi:hypothetical protein